MRTIYDVDKNFAIETGIAQEDLRFHDVRSEPFSIHGVYHEDGLFRRMPASVAHQVSEGVEYLHTNTAGGRVRFRTDSPYIAIHTKMNCIGKMPHFALAGSAGFDLYADGLPVSAFVPPFELTEGYEGIHHLPGRKMRDITIYFPLYSNVCSLYIGLQEDAALEAPLPYQYEKPIVFYGSSITQGGCASRSGTSYSALLAAKLDSDFWNLGFSGNARGEQAIVDYIAGLSMSVFVMDYDYNAPNTEHLAQTHEPMFQAIRKAQPDLPIVMLSRPQYYLNADGKKRRKVIRRTYENALAAGDKNVYFMDGPTLMRLCKDEGLVDSCHPTDLGFWSMAKSLYPLLKKLL